MYTDGGCIRVPGGTRAGYGVYWGEGDQRNEARALRGQEQTAQRAEVAALARALNTTGEPIQVVSDSRYTVKGAQHILDGNPLKSTSRHKDLWQQIKKPHMLAGIKWTKAHTEGEEPTKKRFHSRRPARK